eukprot:337931-Amphidinium_carterae.1
MVELHEVGVAEMLSKPIRTTSMPSFISQLSFRTRSCQEATKGRWPGQLHLLEVATSFSTRELYTPFRYHSQPFLLRTGASECSARRVKDKMLWEFLDIKPATVVVPRFLCKPPSIADCEKILGPLECIAMAVALASSYNSP